MEEGVCDINQGVHGFNVEVEVFESVENGNKLRKELRGDLGGVGKKKTEGLKELESGVSGFGLKIEIWVNREK